MAKKVILWLKPQILPEYTVYDIATKCVPPNWKKVFDNALPELEDISNILVEKEQKNGPFFPNKQNLFRAFELTPLARVKVVIFGQDPYHSTSFQLGGEPVAQGLAFSVNRRDKIPPSLKNIFTEISKSVPGFVLPTHGDLSSWAKQGVFLCNACLTVDPGNAGSHGEIWLGFIRHVIEAILEQNKRTIFLLWGKKAQKLTNLIGNKGKILTAGHPSPFSVKHFYGCNHFSLVNEYLKEIGSEVIDWNLP